MTSAPIIHRTNRHVSNTSLQPLRIQVTLDLCISALSKSIFHPFIACLLPLCLRALAVPYHTTSFVVSSIFALIVCVFHILAIVNQRVAYGPPGQIKWEHEVVVVTGGLGGLGGCVAEIYGLRGVSVAVLDTCAPKALDCVEEENLHYYRCDIADLTQLETVWTKIAHDLGTPTILINNAAISHSSPLVYTKQEVIEQVFRVNTLSHFWLAQHFLQPLVKRHRGGTLVTISSVLGRLGAANLSAYTASKAALLAYHASLSAELAVTAPQLKTILVVPGQLDTELFAQAKVQGWLQNFVGPVVGAGELAVRIVDMIDQGRGGEIRFPEFVRWVAVVDILPVSIQKWFRWWSGVDTAMVRPGEAEKDPDSEQTTEGTTDVKSDTEEDEEEESDNSSDQKTQ